MLIDGELVEASSGKRFDNVNPATEEVLGRSPTPARGHAARDRRGPPGLRRDRLVHRPRLPQAVPPAAAGGARGRAGGAARGARRRGRLPDRLTYGPQLDAPLGDALQWPAEMIDEFAWERDLPDGDAFGMHATRKVVKEPRASSARSCRGTTRSRSRRRRSARRSPRATPSSSSPRPTRRGTRHGSAASSPRRPTSRPASSTSSRRPTTSSARSSSSPAVDMISFTGSTATGKRIMEKGAATLKRLFLELGGKSADIVLDDADFAATMSRGVHGLHARRPGLRHADPHAAAALALRRGVEIADAGLRERPVRRPDRPRQPHGPADQREAARPRARLHREGHGRRRTRRRRWRPPRHLAKGWFVEPTLFADVDNSMTIAREEIFGPVLVVIPFDDDDDAVRIANDSQYGLAGCVTSATEDAGAGGRPPDPRRHDQRQRRRLVRRRRAVRRLQGQRRRSPERASRASSSTPRPRPSPSTSPPTDRHAARPAGASSIAVKDGLHERTAARENSEGAHARARHVVGTTDWS